MSSAAPPGRSSGRFPRQLVARLGGLLGFRDLRDDIPLGARKRKSIRDFASWRSRKDVPAWCHQLQAKEQAFGVLLLGRRQRRFTPAELRLSSLSAIKLEWPSKTAT